jgi:hypothetical protein
MVEEVVFCLLKAIEPSRCNTIIITWHFDQTSPAQVILLGSWKRRICLVFTSLMSKHNGMLPHLRYSLKRLVIIRTPCNDLYYSVLLGLTNVLLKTYPYKAFTIYSLSMGLNTLSPSGVSHLMHTRRFM